MSNKELYDKMAQAVIAGEPEEAAELAQKGLDEGLDPVDMINEGFTPGIDFVGEKFAEGEYFLPDLVLAGEAMKGAMAVLEPEMAKRGTEQKVLGRVVLGTVEGDIHDIGKTLVGTMLAASGFQVHDLGVDVPVEKFVEKARDANADIVGLSALLTTTMVRQKDVIEALDDMGMDQVKVMVGGAPVTSSWSDEIGADGYSEDAIGAVGVAKKLVGA